MTGRIAAIAIVLSAIVAGAAMYWMQVYAFYDRLPETTVLRVSTETGVQPLSLAAFEGIDANSSPLRFRACARLAEMTEVAHALPATDPDPLTAPGWFGCFDAEAIGTAIKRGEATAYLSEREIHRGVDRLIAVFPDGRAYAWHQLNGTLED
ncbi:hypothetical protein SAMN05421774_102236 [Gemmobacter megaterium]|uniref:Histidine kinase n=1 Tax=Gemmobacter megaterium TaxID=1086013 RepID=A0A1N7LXB2_9RHOB|nr:DUF6446 family protein [Gemmobacter megaterium]GGE10137.1 hypothetical protein GCM10011345_15010 [Gemmobacter megaterium]SIS78473.1 hypothetical protein SAMN05421774_102236 [Gemmobacter megaterium]